MKNKDFFLISAGSSFCLGSLKAACEEKVKPWSLNNAVYVREGFPCLVYNHENWSQGLWVLCGTYFP